MGLESYLIYVSFETPIPKTDILDLMEYSGATFLSNSSNSSTLNTHRHVFFEIRSELGLTQFEVISSADKISVTGLSIRFSILSPASVIDQTFEFLHKLKSQRNLNVFDTDNKSKELSLDAFEFKLNSDKVRKRQIVINNKTGLIIEGGSATTEYIHANNLMTKIWGDDEGSA